MDPGHQDVADRNLLNRHVRYYGDDVAVVIAEDEVSAMQGVRALRVEYEELPFVLDVQKAMEPSAPQLHEAFPGNILKHTDIRKGDYQTAIQEPGLIKVEGWYDTPTVQHRHIENHGCFASAENGRIVVVTSTQIPHIIRRIVGQMCIRDRPVGVSIVSTCTAYLCCQPLKWGKNAVEAITGSEVVGSLAYVLLLVGLFYLFNRFLVRSAYTTMTYSKQALVLFGSLPVTYYIFDYATTVYSNALYAGIQAVNEFVPTLLVTFYILFLPAFHDQMQHLSLIHI